MITNIYIYSVHLLNLSRTIFLSSFPDCPVSFSGIFKILDLKKKPTF